MELQEENTTIQIQEDAAPTSHWVADITNDYHKCVSLENSGSGQSVKCISKWPRDLVKLVGKGIHREPQMVAIGPYHHGRKHLQPMEDDKKKALFRLLSLSPGLEVSNFVEALKQQEQELRDHYDELDAGNWPSDSFIKMMLLDGCFLLDFLNNELDQYLKPPLDQSIRKQLVYADDVLIRDIFYLLENQIPRLVLDVLSDVLLNANSCEWLTTRKDPIFSESLHLVDAERRLLLLEVPGPVSQCSCPERQDSASGQPVDRPSTAIKDLALAILPKKEKFVRSARKLHEAGVSFKKKEDSLGLFDVSFSRGVISLPELVLVETSEAQLMNMVAYERMHPPDDRVITSFMSFMNALIDTAEDVSILGKAGIVINNLGSDEAAANIFNKLGMVDMAEMCSPFDKVLEEVLNYASLPHHGWWGHFKDTYLANPWTILSLTGALCLLFLATVQTVYTVLSYYHTNNGSGK